MSKKTHSYKDSFGLWVACCECERGGNGTAKDKCSSGWTCKKWDSLGCYLGKLIAGIQPKEEAKL